MCNASASADTARMTNAHEFADRLARLLEQEHVAMAEFLLALVEFDRSRGWEELGYNSLFTFLHRRLGLSKGAAHYRKTAAELVGRYPQIIEPLRDGRLCITALTSLARVITPENQQEILPRFFHRSKREAMSVAAEIQPATAVPYRTVVTQVQARESVANGVQPVEPGAAGGPGEAVASGVQLVPGEAVASVGGVAGGVQPVEPGVATAPREDVAGGVQPVEPGAATAPREDVAEGVQPVEPGAATAPREDVVGGVQPVEPANGTAHIGDAAVEVHADEAKRGDSGPASGTLTRPVDMATRSAAAPVQSYWVVPLTATLFRIHVTVTTAFLQKMELARDALSHTHPRPDTEAILETGLDLILARYAKRRGLTKNPRKQGPDIIAAASAARIPAAILRQVWIRDGGRCQWPLELGGVCGSTYRVQCDHFVPCALGGPSTLENLRLLCAFHNALAARRVFGDDYMDQFTRESGSPKPGRAREASKAPTSLREALKRMTALKEDAAVPPRFPSTPTPAASGKGTPAKNGSPGSSGAE